MRRAEAEAVGSTPSDRWGEDTLFCEGLLRRGGRIRYEPGAIVYHSRRPLWKPHLRQLYRWSRHRSAYARTVGGNSLRPAYFAPSALLLFLLSGLRRARAVAAPVADAASCSTPSPVSLAGADRSPARWLRVSGGIVATHLVYGSGFLAGLLGLKPPR